MLYTFQANVFNKRIGSQFDVITSITISANNETETYEEAKNLLINIFIL